MTSTRRCTRRRPVEVALLAAAALVLVAGCGGGDDDTDADPSPSATPSAAISLSSTPDPSASGTPSDTPSASTTATPPSGTATPSGTASPGASGSPSASASASPGVSASPSASTTPGTAPVDFGTSASQVIARQPVFGGGGACARATLGEVAIGSIGTYSGVLGELFAPARAALSAFVESQNACNGLNGHPIKLVLGDDQGDPSIAATLTRQQITRDRVLAFVGNMQPNTLVASAPVAGQARVPIIGTDLSSSTSFTSTGVFPQGPSPQSVGFADVQVALSRYKAQRIANVYCLELPRSCTPTRVAVNDTAKSFGATVVYDKRVSLARPDLLATVCGELKASRADLVVLTLDGTTATKLASTCASAGVRPQYVLNPIGAGNERTILDSAALRDVYVPTQTFPWVAAQTASQRYFQTQFARFGKGAANGDAASKAWTAGALLVAASGGLSAGSPTSDQLRTGLYSVSNSTLGGLTAPLAFTRGQTPRIQYCSFALVAQDSGAAWVRPDGLTRCTTYRTPSDPNR